MTASLRSAVYRGRMRHRRHAPIEHAFTYAHAMLALDLAELPHLFDGRWLWSVDRPNVVSVRRADYLGDPDVALDEAVRRRVAEETGWRPDGRVVLVTLPRCLGYCFNPVSFYHCHDRDDRLVALVAEITNTPWNERHAYVLVPDGAVDADGRMRFRFPKAFHVSPFFGMRQEYVWSCSPAGDQLSVHMENHEDGRLVFDATLTMERRPLDGRALAGWLFAFPFATGRVIAAIYWQALRLRLKGAPCFPHPETRSNAAPPVESPR